jgi:hypothetical protein
MWNVPNVLDVRLTTPPAPGSPQFETDAKELRDIAKNLTNEQRKIANWWSDGLEPIHLRAIGTDVPKNTSSNMK